MISSLVYAVLCVSVLPGLGDNATELKARAWFQPASIRLPDERTYVLLFFTSLQPREVAPLIAKLNKLHRRKDVVVVGLSPESEARVKKFIDQEKIRFTVGAGSPTYRDFKIKRFPQVLVVEPSRGEKRGERVFLDMESLDRRFRTAPEEQTMESGGFESDSPVELLRRHALGDENDRERARAVGLLRKRLDATEFMQLCDEILEREYAPSLRGAVAYQKHLADPSIEQKEELFAPSVLGRKDLRANPEDPKWDPVYRYYEGVADRSADDLFDDYLARLTDDAVDVQIRNSIPRYLERLGESDAAARPIARRHLMEMLTSEPDAAIRQRIVGALGILCSPGDFEAADFLEKRLQTETNVRLVRPMMEYHIRRLRTGEE